MERLQTKTQPTAGWGAAQCCVLLWFCEELGQITWGVLSVTLCLSPLTLALLCVGHCTQVPAAGEAALLRPGTPALCLPGQSRTWVQVDSSPLMSMIDPLCPSPPCLILVLKTTPLPAFKKKNHFFGASSACLEKKLEGCFLCLENQGCNFPEVLSFYWPPVRSSLFSEGKCHETGLLFC